jgi:hypothetical protein
VALPPTPIAYEKTALERLVKLPPAWRDSGAENRGRGTFLSKYHGFIAAKP